MRAGGLRVVEHGLGRTFFDDLAAGEDEDAVGRAAPKPSSCVTTTSVSPSRLRSSSTSSTSCFNSGSSALVISSHSSARFHRHGAGYSDTLLLPSRQLARIGVGAIGQADSLEQFHCPLACLTWRLAEYVHGSFDDVAQGRQVRKELEVLENHSQQAADPGDAFAVLSNFPRSQAMRPDVNLASIECGQPVQAPQKSGFATATGTDQGGRFTRAATCSRR